MDYIVEVADDGVGRADVQELLALVNDVGDRRGLLRRHARYRAGFSRTAVNSESGGKSPLSGLVTAACVLVYIYKLSGALYWIPKATLSGVIITAV